MSYIPNTQQAGMENFVSQKTRNVSFQVPYITVPYITLTLDNNSNSIPYKINVTTTGFQIKFQTNYTGEVAWTSQTIQ